MSRRYVAGLLTESIDPLRVPNAPTNVSATAGNASASVAFTAPTNTGGGAITGYAVGSNPGSILGTGATSPVSVNGLTNGTSYVFQVWAINAYGPGPFAVTGSVTPTAPAVRGLFGGGDGSNTISYVDISTTGNAVDFGDLLYGSVYTSACSSSTRAVWFIGSGWGTMNYVTIATTGNATTFGSVTDRTRGAGLANETRGIFAGGLDSYANYLARIDYITIATTGNATLFGNLLATTAGLAGCGSSTRGILGGGYTPTTINVIQYITIASTGNATDFGDLTEAVNRLAACSSSTRGLFAGGVGAPTNTISYITIASTGNATDFGDLTAATYANAGTSSETRGVFAGGEAGTTSSIDYVTIATTGNAANFGSLGANRSGMGACSSGHGGLQ